MNKKNIIFLYLILMYLPGYPQSDSIQKLSHDTLFNTVPQSLHEKSRDKNSRGLQNQIYKLKPIVDIPIIAVGTLWSIYAFTKIYNKTPPTVSEIDNLKTIDINVIDRCAIYPYSESLDKKSYYPFYASIPLPLIYFFTQKKTRNDFAKLVLLYWEAMSITGLLGTSATFHVDRYRPYAYSSETSMEKKTGSIVKNSFYSGHVQIVATPTFFIAKVFSDYNPDSKIKWVFYGGASVITGVTAYMRLAGGEHFPTDILLGTMTGALAGILVPQYHKPNSQNGPAMSLLPFSSGYVNGVAMKYKF
jgi:membrane-associated phospholipid phosphatase